VFRCLIGSLYRVQGRGAVMSAKGDSNHITFVVRYRITVRAVGRGPERVTINNT
jgi:hypothetical protein